MSFQVHRQPLSQNRGFVTKTLRVMKLILFLILAGLLQVSAKGYAQNYTQKELQTLVTFFEGPTGKKWVTDDTMSTLVKGGLGQAIMASTTETAHKAFCQQVTCYEPPAPAK